MKNNLQTNNVLFKIIVLITCFMLVLFYNRSKACGNEFLSFKNVMVLFTEDAAKKELTVRVKAAVDEPMQLRLFSSDGKLVKEVAISNQKVTIIKDLKKGIYSYVCIDHNMKVKCGKVAL
jgi:hypothetical protein